MLFEAQNEGRKKYACSYYVLALFPINPRFNMKSLVIVFMLALVAFASPSESKADEVPKVGIEFVLSEPAQDQAVTVASNPLVLSYVLAMSPGQPSAALYVSPLRYPKPASDPTPIIDLLQDHPNWLHLCVVRC
jgi:hypothetical protein